MDWRIRVRRLVNDLASYLEELARTLRQGWNTFFFRPADPTPLGLIRIVVGALAFWSLLVLGLDLNDFFGTHGWADPVVIWETQRQRQPLAWSFWFLVPDNLLRPAWLVCLAILGLFTVGLASRVTAVLAWVIVVSTVRRVPIALFGFDQIVSTLMLYLAATFSSGQAISLDRFLNRWRSARAAARQPRPPGSTASRRVTSDEPGAPAPSVPANLALRLIQLHLVFIYAMAGLAKIQGPSWWTGMAIWGTMTAGEFVTRDFTPLAGWPMVLNGLTHASLAFELLYPILIWTRAFRPLLLAGAVLLHLGIAWVAPGLTEFGLAMIGANLAFVSGSWLRSLITGLSQPALQVLYDVACPRCRASMAFLTAADPDRVIEPLDLTAVDVEAVHPSLTRAACMESMHVISRGGKRVTAGFDAFRELCAWLPLIWPFYMIAWLPGVAWAGRRIYNRIARGRPRDVACTDDVCGIQPPGRASNSGSTDRRLASPSGAETVRSEEIKHP
jgi:predicted DCC family thiol-disulfide oxidoreductase YuxK